jgi:hypothetical protein
VVLEDGRSFEEVRSPRDEHSSFTGRQGLGPVKTEHAGIAEAARAATPILRSDGFGSVFYEGNPRDPTDLEEGVVVWNPAVEIH